MTSAENTEESLASHLDKTVAALTNDASGVAELVGDPGDTTQLIDAALKVLTTSTTINPADVRHCVPNGDRWTVAELSELVLAPVAQLPYGRNWVIVVSDAAAMAAGAAARLLRTIEEPPTPVWFVLCRDPETTLDIPVAGRVTFSVVLPTEPGDARLRAALDEAGVAERFNEVVAATYATRAPVQAADQLVAPLREISKTLRPRPAGPWLRRLAHATLDSWGKEALQVLRTYPRDPAVGEAVQRYAAAEVQARSALALFTPPESLFGPVLVARRLVQDAATAART